MSNVIKRTHLGRIAAKFRDVSLHPLQRCDLITDAVESASAAVVLLQLI